MSDTDFFADVMLGLGAVLYAWLGTPAIISGANFIVGRIAYRRYMARTPAGKGDA